MMDNFERVLTGIVALTMFGLLFSNGIVTAIGVIVFFIIAWTVGFIIDKLNEAKKK